MDSLGAFFLGQTPSIFLSHSGADTEAARELKRRLLASPDAQKAGLKVWFDKDDLRPGGQWQPQIEQAIKNDATAFVVYVGSRGVINWVDIEVRTALSRAATDKNFLFVPAIAAASGANSLPPFASLYQGVRDPLGNGDELVKLLKAVLNLDWDASPVVLKEPFVGLRSMREEEADRFFGRDAEIQELADRLRKHRIVAIVADSGTGKSSLAEAGFIPAFRGGALSDPTRSEPDDRVWNVVSMRPLSNPEEGLRTGVSEAAEKLGRSGDDRAGLRGRIAFGDPSETAFALQCDLPTKKTATLLIVDQFEELFTASPNALQAPFVRLLLGLADSDKDIRVLLTVRADYFNLLSGVKNDAGKPDRGVDGKTLFERLNADSGEAILRLKRISDEGLRDAVCKPLRLAGERDELALLALAKAVKRDISDQPSDLPLLQVALRAAWHEYQASGKSLLVAYEFVGGMRGALANEAEKALKKLSADDRGRLESIFVRLVRLGETGGATRRAAALDEFDERRRDLLQRLGSGEFGSLVAVGQATAEIAHEALIAQWPWLAARLNADASNIRRLDRLITKALEWAGAPEEWKSEYLAHGAERDLFSELAERRPVWLSATEKNFVAASLKGHRDEMDADRRERERKLADARTIARRTRVGAVAAVALALAAGAFALYAQHERRVADTAAYAAEKEKAAADRYAHDAIAAANDAGTQKEIAVLRAQEADDARKEAVKNEFVALTALADSEAEKHPIKAAKLALAAWPRDNDDTVTPKFAQSLQVIDRVVPNLREIRSFRGDQFVVLSADGRRLIAVSDALKPEVWDMVSGKLVTELVGHKGEVNSAAFSLDGKRIVTTSKDHTARLWDARTGDALSVLSEPGAEMVSAIVSSDGNRIVTSYSQENRARLWDAKLQRMVADLDGQYPEFNRNGTRISTNVGAGAGALYDAVSGRGIGHAIPEDPPGYIYGPPSAFTPDGTRLVTIDGVGSVLIWDAESGTEISIDEKRPTNFLSVGADRLATVSVDEGGKEIGSVWEIATGRLITEFADQLDKTASVALSKDGTEVVTASEDGSISLWATNSERTLLSKFELHQGPLTSAVFSLDAKRIVTIARNNTVSVWDVGSREIIATLVGHDAPVSSVILSADDNTGSTVSEDRTGRTWDIGPIPQFPEATSLELACALLKRVENPVRTSDITKFPLTIHPLCDKDIPMPDLAGEAEKPALTK